MGALGLAMYKAGAAKRPRLCTLLSIAPIRTNVCKFSLCEGPKLKIMPSLCGRRPHRLGIRLSVDPNSGGGAGTRKQPALRAPLRLRRSGCLALCSRNVVGLLFKTFETFLKNRFLGGVYLSSATCVNGLEWTYR